MLAYTDIFDNIRRFSAYCDAHGVQLVLATKTIPTETLQAVHHDFPSLVFGENRQQELCAKYFAGPTWYFIGRLQRNKVKYLVDKVSCICSVDSLPLAAEIEARCLAAQRTMDVLVEFNLGEQQKGGVSLDDLPDLLSGIATMPHLALQGLMVVLPQQDAPRYAAMAHDVFVRAQASFPSLTRLSMGMTADYQIAVANGSNSIRIGSAIFGERSYYGQN